ncbi:MAG: hypothetical protein Q4C50_12690 [Eubacteriales bacterium]|nr:hypothetical protein [Eubacteriales bacterium]
MKKGIIGFLVSAFCMSLLTGGGAAAANTPSDVPATSNLTSSDEGVSAFTSTFSDEELQMLQVLQFDDYRHMTIAEFQNKVWKMTDTPEYSELLSCLSKDETLYALRDSDETAAFIYYVLEPLTKEKWQSHTYSGAASSDFPAGQDNAILEYTYTLTILNADKVKVKDYCDTRVNVRDAMNSMMLNRMKEQLRSEEFMLAELKTFVDGILPYFQTPDLTVDIEYAYFPLSAAEENRQGAGSDTDADQEQRTTPNGTESDYQSLLTLKTPDYQDMSLADFNAALLAWADKDYERMERIDEDDRYNDFKVSLSDAERSFVEWTVFLSGHENAQAVRSAYTGEQENDPWYDQYLPMRFGASDGRSGYCSLYYQFSWHIADKSAVTVGERDRQISGMMKTVQDFWNETDTEELLKMSKADIVEKLQEIMGAYSTSNITITTSENYVGFENIK